MRRTLWLTLLALVLVGLALWSALRSDQPHYQGKSLYSWLDQHAKASEAGDENARNEAAMAIRHIGTNALPTLLHWLTRTDSPARQKLLANWPFGEQAPSWMRLEPAHARHSLTTYACGVLKSIAKPMVPALIALLKDPDPYVRSSAAFALDRIGPAADEAIPALLESLADREVMNNAWAALKDLDAKPDFIVAASVRRLASTNTHEQLCGLWTLSQCGTNARTAVPHIMQFLANPHLGLRMTATNALNRIAPEASANAEGK